MYVSHFYRQEDLKKVADFVREHDFATLVLSQDGIPVASHLLMEFRNRPRWDLAGQRPHGARQ